MKIVKLTEEAHRELKVLNWELRAVDESIDLALRALVERKAELLQAFWDQVQAIAEVDREKVKNLRVMWASGYIQVDEFSGEDEQYSELRAGDD